MTNQEINEAVARKLGWTFTKSKHGHWFVVDPSGKQHEPGFGRWVPFDSATGKQNSEMKPTDYCADLIPNYCASIAAAWEIPGLESLIRRFDGGWCARFGDGAEPETYYEVGVYREATNTATADTAPMAICLAFLKLP